MPVRVSRNPLRGKDALLSTLKINAAFQVLGLVGRPTLNKMKLLPEAHFVRHFESGAKYTGHMCNETLMNF